MHKIKKAKAFTLFEVLVALAILSIAMVASLMTTDNVLYQTSALEKKILAHWVGMNTLNSLELKLLKIKLGESSEIKQTGSSILRNQDFFWELQIKKKPADASNLFNIEIKVYDPQKRSNLIDMVSRDVFIS